MARIARVVAPGYPHHVTQRGNRRQKTFFSDQDHRAYLDLMAEWCGRQGVSVWAYCLLPNHVRPVVVPESEGGPFIETLEPTLALPLRPGKRAPRHRMNLN